MVIIDSDVFLIAYCFPRDVRADITMHFLAVAEDAEPGLVIYNLMEILGILSFSLSPARLASWPDWLKARHRLAILWPEVDNTGAQAFFEQMIYHLPLARMQAHRMPFVDALVIEVVERTPNVQAFVTWNARHFKGKTRLTVLTPAEYLTGQAET
jgi:hypothetical protein